MTTTPPRRSGFAALIGRPNVGKSTLLNRLAGEKIAIVSPKPQTTRNRIMAVVTRPEGQIAFLDTPGVHRAKGELNRYMVETALGALADVDVAVFVVEASEGAGATPEIGEGNRFILDRLKREKKPTLLVLNKVDTVKKAFLLPLIRLYQDQYPFAEVIPVSALKGEGTDLLFQSVLKLLPEGEPLFSEDTLTDQAERQLVAEFIREQLLRHCRQEIPYSSAVVVDHFDESERTPGTGEPPTPDAPGSARKRPRGGLMGLVRIEASIFVERESQKSIVIGKRGQMLKTIGTDARRNIERLLGAHVFLSLRVRVEDRWSERVDGLRKVGYP